MSNILNRPFMDPAFIAQLREERRIAEAQQDDPGDARPGEPRENRPMRKHWDHYFLDLAEQASTRSTCDRKHVGCVIVRDNAILTTGYNGSVRGLGHCDDEGHDMDEGNHCVRTVHAEANAVAQAAREGIALKGSTAYVNTYPCWPCFRLMVNAGVHKIIFRDGYRVDPRVDKAAVKLGILVMQAGCYYCGSPILADSEDFERPLCCEHFEDKSLHTEKHERRKSESHKPRST